ncbi:MAG: PIG-L deacetylase family protein [Aulosira sp. ZfuVER01]|nr:PIG-L deacetylase family protein [Aulosira sp. ZfuVER01]MDZ8002497.1 PIG-L deacetylase family protein [Aulosira sp. DedVER01a]MDZ8050825.1 PIG-L deacetylase family protein [Aulosira sp. ZfuCHP01]
MDIKTHLYKSKKIIKKIFPKSWIEQMQYMQSSVVIQWILNNRSKLLAFNQKSVMVFSPHQDDETFGCGGMIALKREHGVSVTVVFLTDGQLSGSSGNNSQNKLVTIRKEEAVKALTILGVEPSKIYFLDRADGQLSDLAPHERQPTIERIGELLKTYQPEEVYVPHCKDCHRDHEATYELVKEAIKKSEIIVEILQYPIWLFWKAPIFIMLNLQDLAAAYFISISATQEKKSKAISSYRSQLHTLNNGFIQQFLGSHEIFFKSK